MEQKLSTKSSHSEIQQILNKKANSSDISKTFDQISKYLENRPT